MTCQALINQFLHDYHDGTLPPARKLEFEFHLTLCPDCRQYVDSYKKTIGLVKSSPESAVPSAPQELIDAILKIARQP